MVEKIDLWSNIKPYEFFKIRKYEYDETICEYVSKRENKSLYLRCHNNKILNITKMKFETLTFNNFQMIEIVDVITYAYSRLLYSDKTRSLLEKQTVDIETAEDGNYLLFCFDNDRAEVYKQAIKKFGDCYLGFEPDLNAWTLANKMDLEFILPSDETFYVSDEDEEPILMYSHYYLKI